MTKVLASTLKHTESMERIIQVRITSISVTFHRKIFNYKDAPLQHFLMCYTEDLLHFWGTSVPYHYCVLLCSGELCVPVLLAGTALRIGCHLRLGAS